MSRRCLTNFEMQKYYQNEPEINGVYSGNDLPKTKDGEYVINLDQDKSTRTHWIALYVDGNNVIYFDSFELNIFKKVLENSQQTKIS